MIKPNIDKLKLRQLMDVYRDAVHKDIQLHGRTSHEFKALMEFLINSRGLKSEIDLIEKCVLYYAARLEKEVDNSVPLWKQIGFKDEHEFNIGSRRERWTPIN